MNCFTWVKILESVILGKKRFVTNVQMMTFNQEECGSVMTLTGLFIIWMLAEWILIIRRISISIFMFYREKDKDWWWFAFKYWQKLMIYFFSYVFLCFLYQWTMLHILMFPITVKIKPIIIILLYTILSTMSEEHQTKPCQSELGLG